MQKQNYDSLGIMDGVPAYCTQAERKGDQK